MMQVHLQTINVGNAAIEEQIWRLEWDAAKAIEKHYQDVSKGSYEYMAYLCPIRSARRQHRLPIVYTAGFSTGEFANTLACLNIQINIIH